MLTKFNIPDARRKARKAMMSLAQNESSSTMSSRGEEPLAKDEDSTLGDEEDFDIELPKTTPVCFLTLQVDCNIQHQCKPSDCLPLSQSRFLTHASNMILFSIRSTCFYGYRNTYL